MRKPPFRPTSFVLAAALGLGVGIACAMPAFSQPPPAETEDRRIADDLAAMLQAGRAVISGNQDRINDPALGNKGLDGATVLSRSIDLFIAATGTDPRSLDPASRRGRLLHAEMQAIKEVLDANQASINAPGVGFKGFIPAVFSRLVSEAFSQALGGEAKMRVTAPDRLVRNRKSRPDAWEAGVISTRFLARDWPQGQSYEARVEQDGRLVFRIAVPEYYTASCLSCHGTPRGATDLTGYPKEGAALHDLGGVISITLVK